MTATMSSANGTRAVPALDLAAWLSEDVLLVSGRFRPTDGDRTPVVVVALDGTSLSGRARTFAVGDADSDGLLPRLATVRVLGRRATRPRTVALSVADDSVAGLGPGRPTEVFVDLRTLLRTRLAALPAGTRAAALAFLARTAADHGGSGDLRGLSAGLTIVRDALREPLPQSTAWDEAPFQAHVDRLLRLDDRSLLMLGWLWDAEDRFVRITAVAPEGERIELLDALARVPRPDLEGCFGERTGVRRRIGMLAHLGLQAPSHAADGWLLELEDAGGRAVEVPLPAVVDEPDDAMRALLTAVRDEQHVNTPVLDQAMPAIDALQRRLLADVTIEEVRQLGVPPVRPQTTIVVPLYRRIEYLEHQLAHFADDPDLRDADLVYVLDSPSLADNLLRRAESLHALYGLPFRVVVLSASAGYALASTIGAELGDGRLLLLLNSDVIPARRGWLGDLVRRHEELPRVGAVGPKLLFEDDTIQHAGVYFRQAVDGSGAWENTHFFKGLHRDLPEANVERVVPALTGACLLMDRTLLRHTGGLSGAFVRGDYEDSDLCLRLRREGLQSWYVPQVELYHLEGRSYPSSERLLNARYNTWVHTRIRGEEIRCLMNTPPERWPIR